MRVCPRLRPKGVCACGLPQVSNIRLRPPPRVDIRAARGTRADVPAMGGKMKRASTACIVASLAAASLSACDNRSEYEKRLDNLQEQYEADIRDIRMNAIAEMEERERDGRIDQAAERKRKLREKARTNPDGANAAAIAKMPRNEILATAINSAGFLCAKVRDSFPGSGGIIVNCTEYRSGGGRARYRIDTSTMEVERLN